MSEPELVVPQALTRRRDRSIERLESVRAACRAATLEESYPSIAVYVTGSIGRAEGGDNSDLDIFCVDVAPQADRIGNLESIRLFSQLITINTAGGFPDFSRDGEFLVVHHIDDVLRFLGTSDDDYRNLFTARMLLLLESQALIGDAPYQTAVDRVIDLYRRDHGDSASFRPTFLINDLVRYWKTLCLAHEADRATSDTADKPARRVAVLKLQFNRMWMVFNGLAFLLAGFDGDGVPRAHLEQLVALSPLDRAISIARDNPAARPAIEGLLAEYSWFLEVTDTDKPAISTFFADDEHYREGREHGDRFGAHMDDLLQTVASQTPLRRYLLL